MQRTTYTLLSVVLVSGFSANACGGDDDNSDTMNDGGSADGVMDDAVGDAPGDGMDDAPDDGMDDAMDDAPGDDDNGDGGQIGADCLAASDCTENYCLMFENDMGQEFGFCSRQCTSAEDCPESGWECNLAPYTACVPAQG